MKTKKSGLVAALMLKLNSEFMQDVMRDNPALSL